VQDLLWVLYLPAEQYVSSPCAQCLPFKPSEMGGTCVHFIRPVALTPRSETSELQNLRRNAAEDLPQKVDNVHCTDWHHGISLSHASAITKHITGTNVSKCAFMSKEDFLSIKIYCRLYTYIYLNVLIWRKLQAEFNYFGFFWHFTRCGGKHDKRFTANFLLNFENQPSFAIVMPKTTEACFLAYTVYTVPQ